MDIKNYRHKYRFMGIFYNLIYLLALHQVEMLYRNKQLNASPAHNSIDEDDEDDHSKRSNFHYQHSFIPHYYTTPSQCNFCTQVLWGLIKSGVFNSLLYNNNDIYTII